MKRILVAVGAVVLVLVLILSVSSQIYVSWLWFGSLGFEGVFRTTLLSKAALFTAGFLLFLGFFAGNLVLADKLSRPKAAPIGAVKDKRPRPRKPQLIAGTICLALALWMAVYASGAWTALVQYLNGQPFGTTDPLFGQDVGYYVFQLPFVRFVQTWLASTVLITLLVVAGTYVARLIVARLPQSESKNQKAELRALFNLARPVRVHLAALGAAALLLMVWDYRLGMYDLLYGADGVVYGATYSDIHALLPGLWVALAAAGIAAIAVVASLFVGGWKVAAAGMALWIVAGVGGTWLYPSIVQRLEVQPSESAKERPFIEGNIAFTRSAYGLDRIAELESPAEETLSLADVQANPGTFRNIRLWDPQPLLSTYNQIQSIRLYYDFLDIDVDRYQVDGEPRQVMLAARELSPEKLPSEAQTWVNRRLQFTHGYGVAMSPVNEVTPEGLPNLWMRDVPPQGKLNLTRPEIYYGEATGDYVIVNSAVQEFDYPRGDDNVYASHPDTGGVTLGSALRRALIAWRFGDVNILISSFLSEDSRILFQRQISHRLSEIAPFLMYDSDPYVVVASGQLFWIQDAYTYTARYPYSTPYQGGWFNYVRNSVKAVTSAYDGSVTFYVADDQDPILRTYATAFPGLFKSMDAMPDELRARLRYPQDLFRIQADMFSAYHMLDPQVFYNREDNWSIPTEKYFKSTVNMEPYYVIARLPGQAREEFVLIRPYTPPNKNNMITWLAARSDAANYGTVLAYKYPKDRLVYGPMQIEARIDQDPTISGQLTLWSQAGSDVIRGNMIVLPVAGANLYVEPIYLQAQGNSLPEMKRVVIAVGNQVSMQTNVESALAQLYPRMPAVAGKPSTAVGSGTAPSAATAAINPQMSDLVRSLQERYSGIQQQMKSLEEELARLAQMLEGTAEIEQ